MSNFQEVFKEWSKLDMKCERAWPTAKGGLEQKISVLFPGPLRFLVIASVYHLCCPYHWLLYTKVWNVRFSFGALPSGYQSCFTVHWESKHACLGFASSLGWLLTNDHQTSECESSAPLPLFGTILRFIYSLDFSWGTRLKFQLCSVKAETSLCSQKLV